MARRKRTQNIEVVRKQPVPVAAPVAERRPWLPALLPHPAFHAIALAAVSIAIYWRSIGNSWASDDLVQLFYNPLVRDWQKVWVVFTQSVWAFNSTLPCNYFRPLHILVYASVYWFSGYQPWPYHLVMILANAGVCALVYLLLRKMIGDWRAALPAAAIFAVHPIHSEVVMWVASVPDLFMTLYVLGALYLFVACGGRPGAVRTACIALLYAAGLLTKETGVMLLPLLAAYEWLPLGRRLRDLRQNLVLYASLVAVFAGYLALRYHALGQLAPGQSVHWSLSRSEFFFSAVWIAGKYLWKLLVPAGLTYWHQFHVIHGPSLLWAAALGVWLLLAAALVAFRKRQPLVSFALVLVALPLIPALNITGIGANVFTERYLYLPSVGFVLLLGLLAGRLVPILPRKALLGAAVAVLVVMAAASVQLAARAKEWHDDFTLLKASVRVSPDATYVRSNLAFWLYQGGRYDEAIAEYRAALQSPPDKEVPLTGLHYGLAGALLAKGQYAEVEVEARRILGMDPSYAKAHMLLGYLAQGRNDFDTARAKFREALQLDPKSSDAMNALGLLECKLEGHKQAAEELYRNAIKINPSHAEARNNLAALLVDESRYEEAIKELQDLLEVRPNYTERYVVYYNLGIACRSLGRGTEAIGWFNRSLEARPGFFEARKALKEVNLDVRKGGQRPLL